MRMGWSSLYTLTKFAYKTHFPEWAPHTHTHTTLHVRRRAPIHTIGETLLTDTIFYHCVFFTELSLPLNLHKMLLKASAFLSPRRVCRENFSNQTRYVSLSPVAGGRVGEKRLVVLYCRVSCPSNPPRGGAVVNYRYQEAFWYKICISSLHFPPPSSASSLLLHSTHVFLNYCRSSSVPRPRRAEGK